MYVVLGLQNWTTSAHVITKLVIVLTTIWNRRIDLLI